jgi:hypothetical protein
VRRVPERFDVYRYEVERPGERPEPRYSFVPVKGTRYAGRDEPIGATPQANDAAAATQPRPAGQVEAPDGSQVVSTEPPVIEIPGRGRIDLDAVIGATEGQASELGRLVRWHPGG